MTVNYIKLVLVLRLTGLICCILFVLVLCFLKNPEKVTSQCHIFSIGWQALWHSFWLEMFLFIWRIVRVLCRFMSKFFFCQKQTEVYLTFAAKSLLDECFHLNLQVLALQIVKDDPSLHENRLFRTLCIVSCCDKELTLIL